MDKQKKIVVGSILGILLIIGSIVLYRSYALYEEEKEFNVIRGKIPDFGYDIKMLSILVDEEKVDTVPEKGNYKVEVTCNKGTGEWDYSNWKLSLSEFEKESRCNIAFTSVSEEELPKIPLDSKSHYFYQTTVASGETYTYTFPEAFEHMIVYQSLTHMGVLKLNNITIGGSNIGGNSGGAGLRKHQDTSVETGDILTFYNQSLSANAIIIYCYND